MGLREARLFSARGWQRTVHARSRAFISASHRLGTHVGFVLFDMCVCRLEGLGQLGFIRDFLNDTGAVGYNTRGVYTHNEVREPRRDKSGVRGPRLCAGLILTVVCMS